MNTQLLIDAVVQRTVVFIAQLATAGGVRAPLAHVANEVFLGLTRELVAQGVKKKVIADMFGVALRTYHRRVRELGRSRTDLGQTLWEAVVAHIRDHEPVTGAEVQRRFRNDDPEVLSGVLNDLVGSGVAYRAGRGEMAVYRLADEADFAQAGSSRDEANRHLVWLHVYRQGPIGLAEVTAITRKLALGSVRSGMSDVVGGSTWSLDVWDGHPLKAEATATLSKVRVMIEDLRERIDAHNAANPPQASLSRVVFYLGQYVDLDDRVAEERLREEKEPLDDSANDE